MEKSKFGLLQNKEILAVFVKWSFRKCSTVLSH